MVVFSAFAASSGGNAADAGGDGGCDKAAHVPKSRHKQHVHSPLVLQVERSHGKSQQQEKGD
jgi:hypothetical protein